MALALLGLALATGCSDDDAGPPAVDQPGLEDAVRSFSSDFMAGDVDAAYDRLTERCQQEAGGEFAVAVETIVEAYPDDDGTLSNYDEDVEGDSATVTYELATEALGQQNERWIIEDGEWRNDDC